MTDLTALHDLLLARGDLEVGSVARLFTSAFGGDGAIVFVVDEAGTQLRVAGAQPGGPSATTLSIPIGYGVVGLVAQNGHAVTLVDDQPRNALHRELLGMAPDGRIARMCLPMRGLGGAILERTGLQAFGDIVRRITDALIGRPSVAPVPVPVPIRSQPPRRL